MQVNAVLQFGIKATLKFNAGGDGGTRAGEVRGQWFCLACLPHQMRAKRIRLCARKQFSQQQVQPAKSLFSQFSIFSPSLLGNSENHRQRTTTSYQSLVPPR